MSRINITKKTFLIENEIKIGRKIQKISNFNNHYIIPLKYETPSIAEIKISGSIDNEIIQDKSENFILIERTNIKTVSLQDFIKHIPSTHIIKILELYHSCCKLLRQLHSFCIFHTNINIYSLLINPQTSYCIFSDFSTSLSTDNNKNFNLNEVSPELFCQYDKLNYFCCPEKRLIQYMLSYKCNILKSSDVDCIVHDMMAYNPIFISIPEDCVERYKHELNDTLKNYIGLNRKTILNNLSNSIDKWDSFSIGTIFLLITNNICNNNTLQNDSMKRFTDIQMLNMNPNYKNRLNIIETISAYNELFGLD